VRRRLSWAVLGTSGVLAVVVATMVSTGEPEEPTAGPKIIVPRADDAVVDLPTSSGPRPSTVFIDVPQVAVTSDAVVPVPPVDPAPPAVAAPKKATSTPAKPVLPVPTVKAPPVMPTPDPAQFYWGPYPGYMNYYGGYGYYGPSGYYDPNRDFDRNRDGGRRGGYWGG
jgi:hypothetical protein